MIHKQNIFIVMWTTYSSTSQTNSNKTNQPSSLTVLDICKIDTYESPAVECIDKPKVIVISPDIDFDDISNNLGYG